MRKALEFIVAGVLGLASLTAGCMPPTAHKTQTQVKQEKQYKPIQRLPLEKQFFTYIDKTPDFDLAKATFMATGLNAWELKEFEKIFDSKLKKVAKSPQMKKAKTTKEKTRAIFEGLYDFRKYTENVSEITSTMARRGNCMGGTIYLRMAAQRNDIDLTSVLVEKHIFSRLKDKNKPTNIENTSHAGFGFTPKYKWEKEITDNKILLREYTENLAIHREKETNQDLALAYFIVSAKIKPRASTIYAVSNLARLNHGSNSEVKALREIYARHQEDDLTKEVLARALSYRNKPEDIQEAITLMLPVANKNPEHKYKNSFMGRLYSKAGRNDKAAHYLKLYSKANSKR